MLCGPTAPQSSCCRFGKTSPVKGYAAVQLYDRIAVDTSGELKMCFSMMLNSVEVSRVHRQSSSTTTSTRRIN
ncbi:hypothetical protein CABS01_17070 [Colletotrichum abscissum]|uniref:uncharacterized protein n=1 Tax=Colletotrichum abscissum TaxID=1671311 RepID=UPI0027D68ABC|nr:uncharacterized protein CABS01_17070 [Colletotrichum abscissum]KAK1494658.1 hypothetical protein CABS01_17070 [Colletotrichum abscissum]